VNLLGCTDGGLGLGQDCTEFEWIAGKPKVKGKCTEVKLIADKVKDAEFVKTGCIPAAVCSKTDPAQIPGTVSKDYVFDATSCMGATKLIATASAAIAVAFAM